MITFEMLSVNLYEFIKMNHFQGFSLNLIKRFAIQILISLYYLNENNIVHCDLKPENILLRKINKSGIKIIDFGSGCFENEKIYTYIQSRFYRAPEIVLGIPYQAAIDMWSFGCILYELYVGYPLFPGEDEKDHMALMMEVAPASERDKDWAADFRRETLKVFGMRFLRCWRRRATSARRSTRTSPEGAMSCDSMTPASV